MSLRAGALASITRNLRNNIPIMVTSEGKEYPVYGVTMIEPGDGEKGKPRLVLDLDEPEAPAVDDEGQPLEPVTNEGGNPSGYGFNG